MKTPPAIPIGALRLTRWVFLAVFFGVTIGLVVCLLLQLWMKGAVFFVSWLICGASAQFVCHATKRFERWQTRCGKKVCG